MGKIDEIKAPIIQELDRFQKEFSQSMHTRVPLLNIITKYILKNKGKQMRPLFVFLSAGVHGEINDSTYRAAALIELLHTATLIHDDVVDEANLRRNAFTISALWKNKIAVLVGDYLLSKGMLLALENKEYAQLELVSRATKQMSEGELLQIEKAIKLDISEEVYFDIIRQKTATLIGASTAAGAASITDQKETIEQFWKLGEYIGIAFQIRDDLLDYTQNSIIGKTSGNDIKEKKITLPLIYMLKNMNKLEQKKLLLSIKYRSKNPKVRKQIIERVKSSGGIEYCQQKMEEYLQKSLDIVNTYEDNEYKKALINLVNYSIKRNK